MRLAAALLGLAACAAPVRDRPARWHVAKMIPASGFEASIHATEGMGDSGPLAPAVIAYVLTAPGSPVRAYFEAWLAEGGDRDTSAEVTALRARATELAGGAPTAVDYARAWVAPVTAPVLHELEVSGGASFPGTALVTCCGTVDPLGPRLIRDRDARGPLLMLVVRNHAARFVMVRWRDRLHSGTLSWDASALPAAFEADATLDADDVAAALIPLHLEARP